MPCLNLQACYELCTNFSTTVDFILTLFMCSITSVFCNLLTTNFAILGFGMIIWALCLEGGGGGEGYVDKEASCALNSCADCTHLGYGRCEM
jgi:hypothetical protein